MDKGCAAWQVNGAIRTTNSCAGLVDNFGFRYWK